ncbi:helix-turn-helix domain-containing protein [Mycobacterium sp. ITM-2016-00316]|uniref:PucR family transcriptional regulator n=1 Tax=Mycobacterium sp. ITM-2016-00316 TaxID=2099695 RepID=UPI002694FB36|nr:helix-turn-helix domain-containing protein [Mycobacterium sp. ITM-2016-00316]WNG83451.1 helix-turn-helix domain-containing protein [Mycobacterium sp. ITM-2016-00316]
MPRDDRPKAVTVDWPAGVMQRPWLTKLEPTEEGPFSGISLLPGRAEELVSLLGEGPVGWAVELGATMADRITSAIPELAVDAVAVEVRRGCEAVALAALTALSGDMHESFPAMPEVLTGPAEVVARGIGIEHMLRSIHLAHATATEVLLDAAARVIPESQRFGEMRRISELLFGLVEVVNERMSSEYARAHEAWLTSSTALRMETVENILSGKEIPLARASRILGYDLSRWHLAVIVWTAGPSPADPAHLRRAADAVLDSAGCTSTIVLPVGAHRVWAWGSRTAHPPVPGEADSVLVPPGVRVATGVDGIGVDGFRGSHQQAAHAARVGAMSTGDQWLLHYIDLDIIAMLSADLPAAGEFVARELGALAGPGASVPVMRHTLKSYLDRDRSLARTAEHLHVARNTVAYRVQRAEQLRGRPATHRRLQLHAALTLAEDLGDAVLPKQA